MCWAITVSRGSLVALGRKVSVLSTGSSDLQLRGNLFSPFVYCFSDMYSVSSACIMACDAWIRWHFHDCIERWGGSMSDVNCLWTQCVAYAACQVLVQCQLRHQACCSGGWGQSPIIPEAQCTSYCVHKHMNLPKEPADRSLVAV